MVRVPLNERIKKVLPSRALSWALLALVGVSPSLAMQQQEEVSGLLKAGIEYHDAGEFDAAIAQYEKALSLEPDNAQALYELAYSASSKGDLEKCVSAALNGLKIDTGFRSELYTIGGSCYSMGGEATKALKLFRKGLRKDPENSGLHFNIAVTLMGKGESARASKHLEESIDAQPSYSSPYFYLGNLDFGEDRRRVERLFYSLRQVMLDPNSERSEVASSTILEMLHLGVEAKGDGDLEITLTPTKKRDPLATLAVMLSMAAVLPEVAEDMTDGTEAEKAVQSLDSFIGMARDLESNEELRETPVWRQAILPVLEFAQDEESLETLLYLVAARAGSDGGAEWLEDHASQLERLGKALAE